MSDTEQAASGATVPRFSLVTAVYNVERYLDDFMQSLERQTFDLRRVELIAVDDGSTDASPRMLESWAERLACTVRIIHKENGGQASARNAGLAIATGEWVSFPDPDDMLHPEYLSIADRFASLHPDAECLGANPIVFDEERGELKAHARSAQYLGGDRMVDLRDDPETFPGGTNISLFRLDRVRQLRLEFDTLLRPTFEDVHFTARFLLALRVPSVGILGTAKYIYRQRAASDSTLQTAWSNPGRFTVVPERGHLDLVHRALARDGFVAEWVQQLLIYDLSWYLSEFDKIESAIDIQPADGATFIELLRKILPHLDAAVVERHSVRKLNPVWVDVLGHALRDETWNSMPTRSRSDRAMRLRRISYRFTGPRPREIIAVGGVRVAPRFSKTMTHSYFGEILLWERILWLPGTGDINVVLDSSPVLKPRHRTIAAPRGRPSPLSRVLRYARLALVDRAAVRRKAMKVLTYIALAPLRILAAAPRYERFRDAWVVMDRYRVAGDNGERLFEYLRRERQDINAWFVIDARSPDWRRVRAVASDRLIRYRSFEWTMLMLNCEWLVSSHVDAPLLTPPEIMRIVGRRTWKFAFLQHGVTQADVSRWLNPKEIDLFVTATEAETESIAGEGTPYVYTRKEVRRTGFPRHDRLLALGSEVKERDRNLILIAPTWRKWLTVPLDIGTRRRGLRDDIWSSDYLQNWEAVLRSRVLAEAGRRGRRRIIFMPHPEMQPLLETLSLPRHVETFRYAGNDVQSLFARCALLVTDYSSVAFEAAFLDRPVIYFQFDRDAVLGGGHIARPGYFEYERDGFGPVVRTVDEAEAAIRAALQVGPHPTEEYLERNARTFDLRDGRASARVTEAIEGLSRGSRAAVDPPPSAS